MKKLILPILTLFFFSCAGPQVYSPSLVIPAQDLDPGAVRVMGSAGPTPVSHTTTGSQQQNHDITGGEDLDTRFAYIGELGVQIGLKEGHMLQVRAWSQLQFPLNRWGLAISDLYWIKDFSMRKSDWKLGIQPAFALIGDESRTQAWGAQFAFVARHDRMDNFAEYVGIAPFYGVYSGERMPFQQEDGSIVNRLPQGYGIGLHGGAEWYFMEKLSARIDINLIYQHDFYFQRQIFLPCFMIGFGYTLL